MIEKIKEFLHIKPKEKPESTEDKIDAMFESLNVDALRLEIGADLVEFSDDICAKLWDLREEYKENLGYIVPPVRVIDNSDLQENCYRVLVRERVVFESYVVPNKKSVLEDIDMNLKNIFIENIDDIFSVDLMEKYLNVVNKNNNWLVWDLTRVYSVSGLKVILVSLIKEGKSISDICGVLEKINEYVVENSCYWESPQRVAKNIVKNF